MKHRKDDEQQPPEDGPDPAGGPSSAGDSGPDRSDEEGGSAVVAARVESAAFDGLTPRQGQAVESLLKEPTIARAALAAGVHERTLRKWLKADPFRKALLRARREAFGQAVGLSQRYAPVAVATLVKVMNDIHASSSARVTAAALLLRFGREGIELDDIVARLEALERSAWGGNGPVAGVARADDEPERENDEPDQED